jgi:hypothetical protein
MGWTYIEPEEAQRLRGGNTVMILKEIFMSQMGKLNYEFIGEEKHLPDIYFLHTKHNF